MRRLLLLALLSLLAACATPVQDQRLIAGRSTVAQVEGFYGQPTRIWPEPDGGQTLEYGQQPFGEHCYLLRFDAEGHWISSRDGLAAAERAKIEPGMSVEQVERLLGHERTRIFFRLSGEDVWDWNVTPPSNGYWLRFNVHFKDGVVVRTTETLIDPERRLFAF
ncbi:MAG TPA: outer membrane protein assembly factor BamE [Burkholderiaceae bacterium]|jgi:hypothetical protein